MQSNTIDLGNPAKREPALSGLAASPASAALGSTLSQVGEPAAVLYNRHHFNCIQCIAGGSGSLYGKRCAVGSELWSAYQHGAVPSGAQHRRAAPQAQTTPPDGNHGGYFSGANERV